MYRCTSEACHFCLDIHKSEAGLFWMISQNVSFDGINTIKGVGLVVGNYRRLDSVVSGVVATFRNRWRLSWIDLAAFLFFLQQ